MDAQAAARLGDEIAHGFGLGAMIVGAVAGALIGAAVLIATTATGGAALAIMAGSIAMGGISTSQIFKGLSTMYSMPEPKTGVLSQGSPNVFINGRNAMRAGDDFALSCTGLPLNHPYWPFKVLIAEGSAKFYINGKPAARVQSKMVCGAHVAVGSHNTFIGGPTVSVAFVLDVEAWVHTGLEALGLVAVGAAAVLAAMFGVAALTGFVLIGTAVMGGMALLGELGDRLGPGYRDLLQGIAGMALLGMGPKIALNGRPKPVVVAEGKVGNSVFRDVNQSARPSARANPDTRTLISNKVTARNLALGRPTPNGNMASAHAEVGVIQQAYDRGLTKGRDMTMNVAGKEVCGYCRSDVVSMAKAAELQSLTIYEKASGKILNWEQGMKRFIERMGE
jgi:uncharacterized Zn-binding protein involved in type VI secretion